VIMWQVFTVLLLISVSSANGVITFERSFGGADTDIGMSVCTTPEGGYVVGGYTKSFAPAGFNFCAVKTDSLGDEEWIKSYGGDGSDQGFSVARTSDGCYILAGATNSYGASNLDFCLIKVDGQGNQSWVKRYGSTAHDEARYVEEISDGGFIVTGGYRSFDLCLFKLDSAGDSVWLHSYGSTAGWEVGHCIRQASDEGYIVAGYTTTEGAGGRDVWLVKTDNLCNTRFRECFGGSDDEEAYFVEETSDNGYIATGYTKSSGSGQKDLLLLKVDSLGNEEWSKTYGDSLNEEGYCVRQTTDGGYVVVGYTESHGAGGADVWLLKTNASGDLTWSRTHGGSCGEVGHSVLQTPDGGYILSGQTGTYGAGVVDIYLVKTDQDGLIGVEEKDYRVQDAGCKLQISPNPFSRCTSIQYHLPVDGRVVLNMYDSSGRLARTLVNDQKKAGDHEVSFGRKGLNCGVYFARMETEAGTEALKLVILR
jgi:hypothetical protein